MNFGVFGVDERLVWVVLCLVFCLPDLVCFGFGCLLFGCRCFLLVAFGLVGLSLLGDDWIGRFCWLWMGFDYVGLRCSVYLFIVNFLVFWYYYFEFIGFRVGARYVGFDSFLSVDKG